MRDSNPKTFASQARTCFTATYLSSTPSGNVDLKLKYMKMYKRGRYRVTDDIIMQL